MSIIEEIFEYPFLMRIFNKLLTDIEKIRLICNKFIYNNKYKLRFNEQYYVNSLHKNDWYFNCLTNVRIYSNFELPINTTHLFYDHKDPINFMLPNTITHLTFGYLFNQHIAQYRFSERERNNGTHKNPIFVKSFIPDSVIHLEFGRCFNKPIEKCIPDSIKHLELGNAFRYTIKDLPESIISLHVYSPNCKIGNSLKLPKSLRDLIIHIRFKNLIKDMISDDVEVEYIK